jgi:hypothetical protein
VNSVFCIAIYGGLIDFLMVFTAGIWRNSSGHAHYFFVILPYFLDQSRVIMGYPVPHAWETNAAFPLEAASVCFCVLSDVPGHGRARMSPPSGDQLLPGLPASALLKAYLDRDFCLFLLHE